MLRLRFLALGIFRVVPRAVKNLGYSGTIRFRFAIRLGLASCIWLVSTTGMTEKIDLIPFHKQEKYNGLAGYIFERSLEYFFILIIFPSGCIS